MHNNKKQI